MSTQELWESANSALHCKKWEAARKFLDELSRRTDCYDQFLDVDYWGVPHELWEVMEDRINVANANSQFNIDSSSSVPTIRGEDLYRTDDEIQWGEVYTSLGIRL